MSALNRKLVRDLWHLRSQLVAIGMVVGCGVAAMITMRGMSDSLGASQRAYYAAYRFADAFASVKRAPERVLDQVRQIPGIRLAESRVVSEVVLDVPGLAEPATGHIVSLPDRGRPLLNDVHLRSGRLPDPEVRGEVLVSEGFALANRFQTGDRIGAVINGRWERLTIVGVALSPEFVYEIAAGGIFPDNRRFGVLWMRRNQLGPALDLDGAFNDLAIALVPGTEIADVLGRLDRLLAPYGGVGAYARRDQLSHRFISDEIKQHEVTGFIIGYIFLGIAAFLLNLVMSRLVNTQRDQIAVLKAFGYGNRPVGLHYLWLGLAPVAFGAVAGSASGVYFGRLLTGVFGQFYHFPVLRYVTSGWVVGLGVLVTVLAAAAGTLGAVRRAIRLPPAEAMRPDAPPIFRSGLSDRLGLSRHLRPEGRMIARTLGRRPLKALLSIVGLAFAIATVVPGRGMYDAVRYMADVVFRDSQRQNATVLFTEPRPLRTRYDLAHLPGVLRVEPFRATPARLRFGPRSYRIALTGLEPGAQLRRLLDRYERETPIPPSGLVLSKGLGDILGLILGDTVLVEVLEGTRPSRLLVVTGLVDDLIGVSALMDAGALSRLLGEEKAMSGAYLSVDPVQAAALYVQLKQMPAVASVSVRETDLANFEKTLAESSRISSRVLVIFAIVIAVGMVYNGSRIALSERARELASLRVLGFTRREVSTMLLGEQAILTVIAIPVGLVLGFGLYALIAVVFSSELFRMPLVISNATYVFAVLVMVVAAVLSAAVVRRRVDRLDLVAVLKTRE